MDDEQKKIKDFINNLASAVIGVVRSGSDEEKKKLMEVIRNMNDKLPDKRGVAEELKGFHLALISLVEGAPVRPEALAAPYSGIYAEILKRAYGRKAGEEAGAEDPERNMKEFLANLAGIVILMLRDGADKDKREFAEKLKGIRNGLADDKGDARAFVHALMELMEGRETDGSGLPGAYGMMYGKVLSEIGKASR